jgi:hypothetical protein
VALKPIGVSPLISRFAGDAFFVITTAAGYYHLVGDYSAIVDGMHYLVVHFVFHIVLSLTHWG